MHSEQRGAVDPPAAMMRPGGHVLQKDWASACCVRPGEQGRQNACPVKFCAKPWGQGLQSAALPPPTSGKNFPEAQSIHASALLEPEFTLKRPVPHNLHRAFSSLPISSDHRPDGHALQVFGSPVGSYATLMEYLPSGQSLHADVTSACPEEFPYFPRGHPSHLYFSVVL